MIKSIIKILRIDKPEDHDIDSADCSIRRREIILNKIFLKNLYIEWYSVFLRAIPLLPEGKLLEIGSGGGFLKQLKPQIITSDILPLEHCDLVLKAEKLPFENNELSAIFMIDVLHHIPDSYEFLSEAQRTLKPGGKIIMIEPANSAWARFIYKNFHHEPFDPKAEKWEFPSTGPLSGANGALPWIIFERDIEIFRNRYAHLSLEGISRHTPLRYLLSGGVSFRSLVPSWSFPFFTIMEKLTNPLSKYFSMFQTITVAKK